MKRILVLMIIAFILLCVGSACRTPDEARVSTKAAVAEVDVWVTPEVDVPVEAAGERPLLPSLTTFSDSAGLDSNITIAEGSVIDGTSRLTSGGANLFAGTTFLLNAALPTQAATAQVWRQETVPLTVERAQAVAAKWGFSGSLYQMATANRGDVGETLGLELEQLPVDFLEYHVFSGAQSLVLTESAFYFADESVPFNYEQPQPFNHRAPRAEATLQAMGLLDFPYTLTEGWGHEVWVNRMVDGFPIDMPEISAGVDENGRLAFASYQPFDNLVVVDTYPLISAESAWQQIQDGIDESILYSITEAERNIETLADQTMGFRYWPREFQSGQEIHLYTSPTVFLPVNEEAAPLIQAQTYLVQADDETRRGLAEQLGINVHFWGTFDASTNTLVLAGWVPVPGLTPLVKNGMVQTGDGFRLLVEPEGEVFILPDAPVDLADGSQVNVFAWAARDAGLAYPVLEWQGIDMQVPNASGETMAMPEMLPEHHLVYSQLDINQVALAYHVYPEMAVDENGRSHQTYWLLPVWRFTGLADNGDMLEFTVQATEQRAANGER